MKGIKYVTFKPSRNVKTKEKWYIEYYFMIPSVLPNQGTWKRFRIYEDINRYKADEYADLLCKSVASALNDGYNPLQKEVNTLPPRSVPH